MKIGGIELHHFFNLTVQPNISILTVVPTTSQSWDDGNYENYGKSFRPKAPRLASRVLSWSRCEGGTQDSYHLDHLYHHLIFMILHSSWSSLIIFIFLTVSIAPPVQSKPLSEACVHLSSPKKGGRWNEASLDDSGMLVTAEAGTLRNALWHPPVFHWLPMVYHCGL